MNKKLYENKNVKVYYNMQDEKAVIDIEKATLDGKNTVLEILKNPTKYNEILKLSDKEIDEKLEEYYG